MELWNLRLWKFLGKRRKMSSIFTKIVNGEIPCYKAAETENHLAFLDINPIAKGHLLAIPKQEVDYLFDLEDEEYKDLMLFSKKVAIALKQVIPCTRVGVAVIGLEVPHAHVHLIPIKGIYDIDFSKPKLKFSDEEFSDLSKKINQLFIANN